jgi:hypothetical protein
LLGGKLNYIDNTTGNYWLDIAFPNDKIYIEYNGGFHDGVVKTGTISKKDFENKERKRYYFLKDRGWKEIKIISEYDYLPSDEVIINEINKAKEWFKINGKGHCHYNIDIGNKINDVKYGKLRRIKDKDLQAKYNAPTPAELVKSMLLPGEIVDISRAVERLSGYRIDTIEEIKKK